MVRGSQRIPPVSPLLPVNEADLGTYLGSSELGEYIETHFRKIIIQPGNLGANDFTLIRMP
jgi:hypothetical protein